MLSFVSFSIVAISLCSSRVRGEPALSNHCWQEHPLSSSSLQCSLDGRIQFDPSISYANRQQQGLGSAERGASYGPWTHPPVCSEVLENIGSKLCVYTNTSFSNGRGISLFTTPRIADKVIALPAWQDPAALPAKYANVETGVLSLKEIPGKGLGGIAKSELKFKDRIMAYTPALLAHPNDGLSTIEREKYWRIAVEQLPQDTRDLYYNLTYVYGQPSVRVQDIVKANAFQLEVGGYAHIAVFPETARLNHDCSPNAQYYLDPNLLTHVVHATRPIAPGEEISLAYTTPLEDTATRQQKLQDGFHFTCSCVRCTAKQTRDATLARMQDLQQSLNDWSASSTGSPEQAHELLQLYHEEGLEGFLDIPDGFAALAYNAVGNDQKASEHAEKARETILLKDWQWTPNLKLWDEMLKDPKKHWSFRRRLE